LPLKPVTLVVNRLFAISQTAITGLKENEKKPANVLDKFCGHKMERILPFFDASFILLRRKIKALSNILDTRKWREGIVLHWNCKFFHLNCKFFTSAANYEKQTVK
jgi:hypothetical protein